MDSIRVDLETLDELLVGRALNEDEKNVVREMAQKLENGEQLDQRRILRIIDLCGINFKPAEVRASRV